MCLKSQWLLHVHFLFNYTIQECCLDVHLVYLLFYYRDQCKYGFDGSVSCYECKCLLAIYAIFLGEAMHHEPCLLFFNATICNMLDLVDPLRSYNELLFWSRNYLLDIILHN